MSKTTLTAKEVETLVKLNTNYKNSKKKLDDTKAELLPNSIAEGKYIAKIGCVQKVGIVQTVIDYKRLIEDHPEINLKKYTTYKDAPRILITDFRDADESFIAKLLH